MSNSYLNNKRIVKPLAAAAIVLAVFAGVRYQLAEPPAGLEPVDDFQMQELVGPWFEVARLDNELEGKGASTLLVYQKDDRTLLAKLAGADPKTGKSKITDYFLDWVGSPNKGAFAKPCWGIFQCGVFVLDTQKNPHTVVLTGPTRKYLWILARVPGIPDKRMRSLQDMLRDLDYDVDALHVWNNLPPVLAPPKEIPSTPPVSGSTPWQKPAENAMPVPAGGPPPMPVGGPPPMPEGGPPPMPPGGPPPMPVGGPPPMPPGGPPPMPAGGPPPMP